MEKSNLPWVEKYRPQKLEDLISHKEILNTIQRFVKEDRLPHLLFYGPPGTGKTTTILAVAKQLYKPKDFNSMVLELNASDDRGIGIVRGPILTFSSTRTIFNSGFKLVILDEADAMTNDAQNALRRVIERFTENTRFCIIGNYLSKIIPALQSRCTRFRFGPLDKEQIIPRLNYVAECESLRLEDSGRDALLTLSRGDMRKVLNILQSTSLAFDPITEEAIHLCVGHPLKRDISNMAKTLLNEDFQTAFTHIKTLKNNKGLALQDIITDLHTYVHQIDFPSEVLMDILIKLADLEHRLSAGCHENLQLPSLIAIFQSPRNTLPTSA